MVHWFSTKIPSNSVGKNNFIPQMVLGQLNLHMQKNAVGPPSQTTCIKMGQRNPSQRAKP